MHQFKNEIISFNDDDDDDDSIGSRHAQVKVKIGRRWAHCNSG